MIEFERHDPCCSCCDGVGADHSCGGPCWDCQGTGHDHPQHDEPEPEYTGTSERHVFYPDACEQCGGSQWDVGGTSYFNGNYQCYTLYLECENCGTYDVECV